MIKKSKKEKRRKRENLASRKECSTREKMERLKKNVFGECQNNWMKS